MIKKIYKGRNGIVENLCMNFYVKYEKKMAIINLNNIVHRQVLVSLYVCSVGITDKSQSTR